MSASLSSHQGNVVCLCPSYKYFYANSSDEIYSWVHRRHEFKRNTRLEVWSLNFTFEIVSYTQRFSANNCFSRTSDCGHTTGIMLACKLRSSKNVTAMLIVICLNEYCYLMVLAVSFTLSKPLHPIGYIAFLGVKYFFLKFEW